MIVSVIIPTYNRGKFIERAVNSVLQQSYPYFEVLVVDDGSTDDTEERINLLCQKDHRVKYIKHRENFGAQVSRNTGIHASKGNLIAFLDSDNEWLPTKLEKQIDVFDSYCNKIGVVYSGFKWKCYDDKFSKEQKPYHSGNIYTKALKEWIADTSTLVVRKEILYNAGLFDIHIRAYQEWDLCIRLARLTKFDYVAEPLVLYHIHDSPTISANAMNNAKGYLDVVKHHKNEILIHCGPFTLSRHYLRIAHLFMEAQHNDLAFKYFIRSVQIAPYNILAISLLILSIPGSSFYFAVRHAKKKLLEKLTNIKNIFIKLEM